MKKFLVGVLVGAVIGVLGASYWAYLAAASVPIVGGLIAAQIRKKVTPDFSGNGKPVEPKFRFGKDIHSKHNRGD
jgi:hypothetical protein